MDSRSWRSETRSREGEMEKQRGWLSGRIRLWGGVVVGEEARAFQQPRLCASSVLATVLSAASNVHLNVKHHERRSVVASRTLGVITLSRCRTESQTTSPLLGVSPPGPVSPVLSLLPCVLLFFLFTFPLLLIAISKSIIWPSFEILGSQARL